MIFGTFDIVHHGHLSLFLQAKKQGDYLIAVVARDARAEKIKEKKLVYTEKERKTFLKAIRYIDEVVLGDTKNVYAVIKKMKPESIVLGYDQYQFTDKLKEKIQEFGLKTKIVRAKSHKPLSLKSQIIRTKLEQNI